MFHVWSIDTYENKVSNDQYQVTIFAGSGLELIEVLCVDRCPSTVFFFSIGSWAHVRLTCYNQGLVVWKPVNTKQGLKFC